MKKVSVLLFLCIVVVILAACSSSSSEEIVGRWVIADVEDKTTQSTYYMQTIREHSLSRNFPKGTVIEFMDNGLVHAAGNSTTYDFPAEGKLRLINGNGNGVDLMVDLIIDGNEMQWDYGDVLLTFERMSSD